MADRDEVEQLAKMLVKSANGRGLRIRAAVTLRALSAELARVKAIIEATQLLIDADERLHAAIDTPGASVGTARVNALEALNHLRDLIACFADEGSEP